MGSESGRLEPADLISALERSASSAEWVTLFEDDFNRASVGEDWRIRNAQARICDGWLRLSNSAGSDVYAVIRRPFADNVRIEFDARFPAGMPSPSDLACFLAGDETRCDNAGYCLSLGADSNTCSRIQRQSVDIRIAPVVAEAGRIYHIAAELIDGHLTLYVDGRPILSYLDMLPLAGPDHDRVGLASYKFGAEFAKVRVMAHSGPSRTGLFTVADAYCRDGLCDNAIEKYRQVAAAYPNQLMGLLAQAKVALALMAGGRWSEAEAQLRGLAGPAKGTDLEYIVALWHGRALGMMGKIDDALRTFGRVQSAAKDAGVIDEVAVACGLLSEELRSEQRWLEAGRCAKFLFENTKTPLIETLHMFNRHGNRLREAALYEEEYQALNRLGMVVAARANDPGQVLSTRLRKSRAAIYTNRVDVAQQIFDELEAQARQEGDRGLELTVLGSRAEIELSLGRYAQALELIGSFAGTEEEETGLRDMDWGSTLADLRAVAVTLLGRVDEALDDLDAGRISHQCTELRMALAAELWRRDRKAAAASCLSEIGPAQPALQAANPVKRMADRFTELTAATLKAEAPVESLLEFVETVLQPVYQPRGLFYAGLAAWANGNDGAAMLSWSDARNSAPEVSPVWHWTGYFLGRVEK